MLINDYYSIIQHEQLPQAEHFVVALNEHCRVYDGHFPGEPVSPGVCNIQMIRECAQMVVGKRMLLSEIKQCRFMKIITPQQQQHLDIMLQLSAADDGTVSVSATVGVGEEIYMSFKGVLS